MYLLTKRTIILGVPKLAFSVGLVAQPGREANENNIYFRCVQESNEVALLDGRGPVGPPAPRGFQMLA